MHARHKSVSSTTSLNLNVPALNVMLTKSRLPNTAVCDDAHKTCLCLTRVLGCQEHTKLVLCMQNHDRAMQQRPLDICTGPPASLDQAVTMLKVSPTIGFYWRCISVSCWTRLSETTRGRAALCNLLTPYEMHQRKLRVIHMRLPCHAPELGLLADSSRCLLRQGARRIASSFHEVCSHVTTIVKSLA